MPVVYVEYLPGFMNQDMAAHLKQLIREDASVRFSTPELTLGVDDFTIIFTELPEWSEPTNPIVVRMQLHAFPERVRKLDADAKLMAQTLSMSYWRKMPLELPFAEFSIGVSLLCGEIGWGTSH